MAFDPKIIQKFQQGDSSCFEEIYNASYKRVYFNVFRLINDENTAKDITQDVLIEVYRSLHTLRVPGSYYIWIDRITRNHVTKEFSKRSHKNEFSIDEVDKILPYEFEKSTKSQPNIEYQQEELMQIILNSIKQLPIYQQEVVKLRFLNERSIKEIAEELNIPEGTVKTRLKTAKATIKSSLESLNIRPSTMIGSFTVIPMIKVFRLWQAEVEATISIPSVDIITSAAPDTIALPFIEKIMNYIHDTDLPARSILAVSALIPTMLFTAGYIEFSKPSLRIDSIQYSSAYTNQPVTVDITVSNSDNVKTIYVVNNTTNDNYAVESFDATFIAKIDSNGEYTLYIEDLRNNVITENFIISSVDKDSPAVSSFTLSDDGKLLIVTVSDSASGINLDNTYFVVDETKQLPSLSQDQLTFAYPSENSGVLHIKDNAGNWIEVDISKHTSVGI